MKRNQHKRLFITGVAGFLGSHLADAFLQDGWEVSGCDNMIGGYLDNVPHGVRFYKYDCTNRKSMKAALKGTDIVYHCAATAYEGLSVFSPHLIMRNIVDATAAVISAALANKVKRFIYCSSMARYGENHVPFTENMIPNPKDPYGIAKVTGELLLKCLAEAHGMEYVIAVPHNIIGPRQKYDDPYRNVASIMINLMLQGRQPIIYGNGLQRRCFSFIDDDMQVLVKLATTDHPDVVRNVVNIGPDEEFVTINTLAETIADIIGFRLDTKYLADRPLEVRDANCSADKARQCLGYKTEYTLRRGLEEMIVWIKKRGTKSFSYHLELEIITNRTPDTWKHRLF